MSNDLNSFGNPFLRNCEHETLEPVCGTVLGSIPKWLQGELVRIGPGINKIGNDHYSHIFDGLAILHKFTVKDGRALYQSRVLQSDAYKKNVAANRIVVSEYGTRSHPDPCQTIFGRLKTEFKSICSILKNGESAIDITDNCCVNVAYYGDQFYAMGETNFLRRVDPHSLATLGDKTNINDYLAVNTATAHPHILEDGTVINVGSIYRHAKGPRYAFFKVPPKDSSAESAFAGAQLIAEIPYRWTIHAGYFHSFSITNTGKIIFAEHPLCMNLLGMGMTAAGLFTNRSYSEWMKWHENEKTRFYVISIEDGKVHPVRYETEELFFFHQINAYEENGELIVDVAGYSDANWIAGMTVTNDMKSLGECSEHPSARRYVLPLNVDEAANGENLVKVGSKATAVLRRGKQIVVDVTPEHLTKDLLELPRINYNFNGKKYTYFYGVQKGKTVKVSYDFAMNTISKVNVKTGEILCWSSDDYWTVSEPVFVQNPTCSNDDDEDDGVILAALLPDHQPTSVSLLILNAKDMSEVARVNFTALGSVTGTFHGQWKNSGGT